MTRAHLGVLAALALASACATVPAPANARADASGVWRDPEDHGRPRCLAGQGVRANVFFRWNDADRYARVIEARRDRRPCAAWRAVALAPDGWRAVHPEDTHVYGRPLEARLAAELAQVRRGARVVDPALDADPARVLAGRRFDTAANVELTERHGHGFAGEVYARSLAARPENAWAFDALERSMRAQLAAGDAASSAEMRERGKGVVVLVSMGYGWDETIDEHTVGYVKDFLNTVRALGAEVEVLERNTYGGLEENAALIAPKVERHLAAGRDVVLFGLCKGSPELYVATARVLAPHLDEARTQERRPKGWGRVRGVLNMSGMMSGIVFSDWLGHWGFAAELLGGALTLWPDRAVQDQGRYLAILPSLTSEKVERFAEGFHGKLPSDAVYLDVIGVVPGDGLLVEDIGAMGPLIEMDRDNDVAKAANDGFIRYPGNELPKGISPRHYQVVMSGSHMLFDGAFGPHSMADLRNQRALFRAAIQFVLAPPDAAVLAGAAP